MSNFGQNVKVNLPATFFVALICDRKSHHISVSVYFLLCTHIQDDDGKTPRKCRDKLSLTKVNKGRCPKALNDLADFSVLCRVRRFTIAVCYQFLISFRCF